MEELRQATEEFVNLLSAISEKYGIESEDIAAMNAGLEKVWRAVTLPEDELALPEEIDDEMEAAEVPEEVEEEDAQA